MKIVSDKDFSENSAIEKIISPFNPENLTPVGVDLTIGGKCYNVTIGKEYDLEDGEILELFHGDFARVFTYENLTVPSDWFGMVYGKVSLAGKGLTHLGTKIDPGFEGKLLLTFQYLGNEPLRFKRGDPICNVAFFRIDAQLGKTYVPMGMKVVRVTLRPPLPSFGILPHEQSRGDLRRFYSKELVEFYESINKWTIEQENKVERMIDKVESTNRTIVTGMIVAGLGALLFGCITVFLGFAVNLLTP
jgi:deoxycytidine triphosphate deaminase